MSTTRIEQRPSLYELLPAVHRVRDAVEGEPLDGLMAVIQEQVELLEQDIDRLYDDWFIETCEEWVVPYLGDLLGISGILPVQDATFSQRGLVANTIAYRRAKGTAAVLEQLAGDVTGWAAKALEFFELLAATRYMNHERRNDVATVNVRDAARAELVGAAFGTALHTGDVRHVDIGRGRYNIPNVGLHLWRLQDYGLTTVTARPAEEPGTYRFNPLGIDAPLFNVPRAERAITELATELNVPGPLRRRPLHDELEARRQAMADGDASLEEAEGSSEMRDARYLDDRQPVFGVSVVEQRPGDAKPLRYQIEPERVVICDLSTRPGSPWRRPPKTKSYVPRGETSPVELPIRVGVDPVLGRLAFPEGDDPDAVEVAYSYGFLGDLGGGLYDRRASLAAELPEPELVTWQMGVGRERDDPAQVAGSIVETLAEAVDQWNDQPAGTIGAIAILDSRSYEEDLTGNQELRIPAGSRLLIVAADWPVDEDEDGATVRRPGRLVPDGLRPHLWGAIDVVGTAGDDADDPGGELVVDGIVVEGDVRVLAGDLGRLRITHSTVAPPDNSLAILADATTGDDNRRLDVELERSICGDVAVADRAHGLHVVKSIVDGSIGGEAGDPATVAPDAEIAGSTVLGPTAVRSIEASESIFSERVTVERRQRGCVRYCYLPIDSLAPRRFHCQPADAVAADVVAPAFASVRYGDPAYCQLARQCPPEITRGAEQQAEMGAWHFLEQPRRLDNLITRLDEYLRFGLEAGVFFVT